MKSTNLLFSALVILFLATSCSSDDSNKVSNIYTGAEITFSKAGNADWTLPENQDKITDLVTFTRQDNRQVYNYQWWQDNNNGEDATGSELEDLFWSEDINQGGTNGVKWAILDDTGADSPWSDDFNLYGTLGDPTNFFSFHNIASIISELNDGNNVIGVANNIEIELSDSSLESSTKMSELVGKKLGVWLEEDDIYFTLTFTDWGSNGNGGSLSYRRTTR